jgi:hypothetical protein
MGRFNSLGLAVFFLCLIALCGCQNLVPHDTQSLLDPKFHRSDVVGQVSDLSSSSCKFLRVLKGIEFGSIKEAVCVSQRFQPCS